MTFIKFTAHRLCLWQAMVTTGCVAMMAAGPVAAQETAQQLPAITLQAGMFNIRAEVAQTPAQRQIGLMHRKSLPLNDGMLFVFEEPSVQCFWMKNTLVPLSAAFVADDGQIVNIADMKPLDESPHCSKQAVRYVLEMNQGWFAKRGLKTGDRLAGPGFAKP